MLDEACSADVLPTLPVREGYDLWAEVHDSDGNPLIALEEADHHPQDERQRHDEVGEDERGVGVDQLRLREQDEPRDQVAGSRAPCARSGWQARCPSA